MKTLTSGGGIASWNQGHPAGGEGDHEPLALLESKRVAREPVSLPLVHCK